MARHGENIRKRKDGRWEGRYPVYSEEKGKKIYFTDSQLGDVFSQCCDLYEDARELTDHADASAGLHAVNAQVDAVFDCDWELMGLLKRAYELADITNGYYQPVFGTVLRLLEENPQPEDALLNEPRIDLGITTFYSASAWLFQC